MYWSTLGESAKFKIAELERDRICDVGESLLARQKSKRERRMNSRLADYVTPDTVEMGNNMIGGEGRVSYATVQEYKSKTGRKEKDNRGEEVW